MEFSRIGLITEQIKGEERLVEKTKVLVTDYNNHPFRVEWLRFRDDTPVTGPVREKSHIAFKVDDLGKASKGLKVLIEPFEGKSGVIVGFYEYKDGSVVELMKYPE